MNAMAMCGCAPALCAYAGDGYVQQLNIHPYCRRLHQPNPAPSASPVSPDAEAMAWAKEAYRNARKMVADNPGLYDPGDADLIANAAALHAYAMREREACAQICDAEAGMRRLRAESPSPGDEHIRPFKQPMVQQSKSITASQLAAAIRARSPQSKEGK